jgi:hypothetical protein
LSAVRQVIVGVVSRTVRTETPTAVAIAGRVMQPSLWSARTRRRLSTALIS